MARPDKKRSDWMSVRMKEEDWDNYEKGAAILQKHLGMTTNKNAFVKAAMEHYSSYLADKFGHAPAEESE